MNRVGAKARRERVVRLVPARDLRDSRRSATRAATRARASWHRARASELAARSSTRLGRRWYRRAYFDDGRRSARRRTTNAGSTRSRSRGRCSPARADRSARGRRWTRSTQPWCDRGDGWCCCFTPPFDQGRPRSRLHQGLLPGVRENGGQYTHAALWCVMAYAKLATATARYELFAHAQSDQPRTTRAGGRSATGSNRTSSRPTSTPNRRTPAAAAGPGTPVGGLDVSRGDRIHARHTRSGRYRTDRAVHPARIGLIPCAIAAAKRPTSYASRIPSRISTGRSISTWMARCVAGDRFPIVRRWAPTSHRRAIARGRRGCCGTGAFPSARRR